MYKKVHIPTHSLTIGNYNYSINCLISLPSLVVTQGDSEVNSNIGDIGQSVVGI